MTPLKSLNLKEFYALDLPEIAWLVHELLASGSVTLLAGREKAGKTMLATDMFCSIAMEVPFLGRQVSPGPILYLPAEENLREIRNRLHIRLAGRDAPIITAPVNGQFGQRLQLSDPQSIAQLIDLIRLVQPAAVFIDPLREVHSGAENDSDEMAPLMRPLRQMAHELDVAIFLLHHMSKGGNARGSTAITAAVDQIITFTRTGEDLDGVRGRLEVNGRFGPRLALNIELGDGLRWQLSNAISFKPTNARDRVLWLLEHTKAELTAPEIADKLDGLEIKTVQNVVSAMLKEQVPPIVAFGTGHKGDKRRYSSVNVSLFECETDYSPRPDPLGDSGFGNNFELFPHYSGNNGNHSGNKEEERRCMDCGGWLEDDQRYRCKACVAEAKARAAA